MVGVGGFCIYQNLSQPGEPAGEKGTGEITEEGAPTGEETEEAASPPAGAGEPRPENSGREEPTSQGETPAESPKTETPEVKSINPIDVLSDDAVNNWGANCKNKGGPLAIASCLLDWQENNIFWCYTNPDAQTYFDYFSPGYPDCVVDMQFQQMSPGLFPVSKVMELKIRDSKIFGACYTYATTYCALARWHGLACRVMEAKTTISFYSASSGDYAPGYCGSAPQSFLDKLSQSCSEWKEKNWVMDADHYWAEVLIDGNWQIMERPTWAYRRDTTKYIIQAGRSYGDTGW